ncbi:MAG: hypothetical protein JHD16_07895 [Solirubrobacteraceae bacterium]|nr:hypothetical protein [Solirubrobacteraceae bacterium]
MTAPAAAPSIETAATTSRPVGTSRLHTSEPRWPTAQPPLDPSARSLVVVAGASSGAQASSATWIAAAQAQGLTVELVASEPGAVGAALAAATAGTRLVVAGDEATIARTLAAAIGAGLVATEVRAHLTDPDGPRTVQCVHCKAITETTAPVDGECACAGCDRPLLIFPHYSRRIGAYLGFRIDSEELPA